MPLPSPNKLDLTGPGAAYVRVSDDQQDTLRQYEALYSFESRHGVKIPKDHWFEDEGWARDTAHVRPDFKRLMQLAEAGRVRWIVVSERDRFGTRDADEFIHFRYLLRQWGCKLYDAADKDWTAEDIGTVIIAAVDGEKSKEEQHGISKRTLGAKAAYARKGEWQGGPVPFGMDVACYDPPPPKGTELWRFVAEGRRRWLKVYPDGRTERYDNALSLRTTDDQVLRLAPTKDPAKLAAAVDVFRRFAGEAVSPTALAHHMIALSFRNSAGGYFQGHHIERMLEDPIYIGYYRWNRSSAGKFHRYRGDQVVKDVNYKKKVRRNDPADWVESPRVESDRLFPPLVDLATWDAVQRKLGQRDRRTPAPRSPGLYLAGLVCCGNCGGAMISGRKHEFICGSYFAAVRVKKQPHGGCLRNGVWQDTLEVYVNRYLEETGQKLRELAGGPDDHLTDRLEDQEAEAWQEFALGMERLTIYLAKHHPDEYDAIVQDSYGEDATPHEFVEACLAAYRANFDPSGLAVEIEQLEAEHTALMGQWADLPTPRAKEKAKGRFAALEARIEELRRQQEDAAEVVATHYQEMLDLQTAVAAAQLAMQGKAGERAFRQRAEQLRKVIHRIECTFVATGKAGRGGGGKANAKLVRVTFYPVAGGARAYDVLPQSNAQALV
jgi:DNA invertase Pin-like site-specific DNA recombinase